MKQALLLFFFLSTVSAAVFMLVIMGQMCNHLWGSESRSVSAGLINTHFWRDFVGFGSSEN